MNTNNSNDALLNIYRNLGKVNPDTNTGCKVSDYTPEPTHQWAHDDYTTWK